MKQFFENYGSVALGILALLVLIAMITPVGNIIKTSLQGKTETFSTRIESQTSTMAAQMQEAFESANTEIHYDENGILLNGVINRTLYIDGVAYQNIWNQSLNGPNSTSWGWERTITDTGYKLESVRANADPSPYFHEVAYDIYGWNYSGSGQLFNFKDGCKYIIYSSNPIFDQLIYNYFDENNIALGPITYTNSLGNVHAKFESFSSNKGIVKRKYNATSFSLRIGVLNVPTNIGTIFETDFMVFEVPEDVEIDLSSL